MPNIIAGRFQELDAAAAAMSRLSALGFGPKQMASFFVGPRGQRDEHPPETGPEQPTGTEQSPQGAATGALGGIGAGAIMGALGGPISVAAGAAVGAYVGSFIGALHPMGNGDDVATAGGPVETPLRKSGVVVAVMASESSSQTNAIDALRKSGAVDIEYAQGNIISGEWTDFDPAARMSLAGDDHDAGRDAQAPTR